MADVDIYTGLLFNSRLMLRRSAALYVQSYDAEQPEHDKLRARAFRHFIDAQALGSRAWMATAGKPCPFLGAELDREIELMRKVPNVEIQS